MYDVPMSMSDKLIWKAETERCFEQLRAELMSTIVFSLPDYTKPFTLTVHSKNE